jgi:hypothetical protein
VSLEATLSMLLDDATPALRETLREAVRRAYETGYREALASAGAARAVDPLPIAAPTEQVSARTETPALPLGEPADPVEVALPPMELFAAPDDDCDVEPEGAAAPPIDLAMLDDAMLEDDPWDDAPSRPSNPSSDTRRAMPEVTPVRPNLTIGKLRTRIVRQFGLERYNIDVVVCRAGDSRRRQLRADRTLRTYLLEEGRG